MGSTAARRQSYWIVTALQEGTAGCLDVAVFGSKGLAGVPELVLVVSIRPTVEESVHHMEMTKIALRKTHTHTVSDRK